MKKIVVREYDSDWKDSGLDYQNEISLMPAHYHKDDYYLALRNANGSINSYNIIEVEHFIEEGVSSCCCKFRSYQNWKSQVELVSRYFRIEFMTNPEALVVNHHTLVRLEEEESIVGNKYGTQGVVGFKEFFLKIKMNSQVKENEFCVISRKVDRLQGKQKEDKIKYMIQMYEELKCSDKQNIEYETLVRINRIVDFLNSIGEESKKNESEVDLGDIRFFISMLTGKESIHLLEAINFGIKSNRVYDTDALNFVLDQVELRLENIRNTF